MNWNLNGMEIFSKNVNNFSIYGNLLFIFGNYGSCCLICYLRLMYIEIKNVLMVLF